MNNLQTTRRKFAQFEQNGDDEVRPFLPLKQNNYRSLRNNKCYKFSLVTSVNYNLFFSFKAVFFQPLETCLMLVLSLINNGSFSIQFLKVFIIELQNCRLLTAVYSVSYCILFSSMNSFITFCQIQPNYFIVHLRFLYSL